MTTPDKSLYADNLWNRIDAVLKQSADRRKELEEFAFAIQKRIETEEMYAKNIELTGNLFDRFIHEKNCAAITYSAFKLDHSHRALQSRTFAQSLKDQVLIMLQNVSSYQNNECKKIEKDARKLQKDLQKFSESLEKAKQKYLNSERKKQEQQILNETGRVSSQLTTDKKQKQISYTKQIEKQTKEFEQVYKLALKEYNDFVDIFNTEMSKVLNIYQEHEKTRIDKQIDTIMKMLVFETSMMRNFDYDITNISRQMQGVKASQDILNFIEKNKTSNMKPTVFAPYQVNNFINITIAKSSTRTFESRIEIQNSKPIRNYIDQILKGEETPQQILFTPSELQNIKKIQQPVSDCWKNRQTKKQQLKIFKDLMQSDKCRHILMIIFKQQSIIFGSELKALGFENTAVLLQVVIQKCVQDKDVFIIRKILSLMFTLWTLQRPLRIVQNRSKQQLLQFRLSLLNVWRSNDFWEAAIFESVQEDLKTSQAPKGQGLQSTIIRQKNLIFKRLATYCVYMIMLGNSSKMVRQVVGKYCRLYDMTEQQSKDLSKTINNTFKQFKQIFGLTQTNEASIIVQDSKLN